MQQFRLYQVSIDYTKYCLRTAPSTPYSPSQGGDEKDPEKEDPEQEWHQVELLHIEAHEEEVQLHMVEVEQEKVVPVYAYPWQYQAHDRHDRKHHIAFIAVGNPVLQILLRPGGFGHFLLLGYCSHRLSFLLVYIALLCRE